jgi:hypothetical protein
VSSDKQAWLYNFKSVNLMKLEVYYRFLNSRSAGACSRLALDGACSVVGGLHFLTPSLTTRSKLHSSRLVAKSPPFYARSFGNQSNTAGVAELDPWLLSLWHPITCKHPGKISCFVCI